MCVCVRRHACQEFFWGEGAFGGCMCMHARMTCTYCMDVCALVEQLCCIQLLHTRAHAQQVLRGRLTFPFLISFFFFLIFIWFRVCWICLSMRFCLFIHFFQCCFFRFCSHTLKFERATTWWISWKRCSLFPPILRKLLSNVHASDVGGTQHETIYLGVHCSGFFFSDKVWELFDARPFP